MWSNFFLVFGFFAGTLAIPSLGAALDAAISERAKARVRDWVERQTANMREARFGGSKVFDFVFGPKVVSYRGLAVSVCLSILSIFAGASIAYFTSSEDVRSHIFPVMDRITIFNIVTVFVFLLFVVVGDFVSYAQTRIFFVALDRVRNVYISALLYVADLALSIGIFVFFYSVAKAIMTIAAITTFYQDHHLVVSRIAPEVVVQAASAWNIKQTHRITGALERALWDYRAHPSVEHGRELDRQIINLTYARPDQLIESSTSPVIYCLNDLSIAAEAKTHVYELLRDSENLANRAIGLGAVSVTFGGEASFSSLLPAPLSGDGCSIHVVERSSVISMAKVTRGINWGDFLVGSVAMTMHELELAIVTKFSALTYDDPVSSALPLLQYALMAASSRPLGVGQARVAGSIDVAMPSGNPGHVFIPFSVLAFSSLGANIIFVGYMMIGFLISTGNWFMSIPLVGKHIRKDAVFFRISVSATVFIIASVAGVFALEEGLRGALWLAFQRTW